MSQLQQNIGLSFNRPSGVDNLDQLSQQIAGSSNYKLAKSNEQNRNVPLPAGTLEQVYQVLGVNRDGSAIINPVPFVTINTKQTIVNKSTASSTSVGSPSAVPVVTDNKNLNLQAGLGIDDIIDVIIPYARSATIRFTANKLKPNTRYYAFFNEYNVTQFCNTGNIVANVSSFSNTTMTSKLESKRIANIDSVSTANVLIAEKGNIFSDYRGFVSGVFNFDTSVGLKIPSGQIKFRLTDSSTNGEDKESFADAIYTSIGRVNRIPPPPLPPEPIPPTYGSGGVRPSRGGGRTNDTLPTPGNREVRVDPPEDPQYGYLDHHISYLKNIPLSAITPAMRDEFSSYFANSRGGSVITNDTKLKQLVPGAVNYGINDIKQNGNFNFSSGNNVPPQNRNDILSNGQTAGTYLTGTNILEAKDSNGKSYVQHVEETVRQQGGNDAWNMVVGQYDAVRTATQNAVNSGNLTPEMKSFWETGLKNGSFTDTADGIQRAINNFSAAVVDGMLSQNSTASKNASIGTQMNGFRP